MSEIHTSRRAVIAAVGGVAAAGALASVSTGASALALPHAIFDHRKAVLDDHIASEARNVSDAIQDALHWRIPAAADKLWATPVTSWGDVIARAELAAYWNQDELWDEFESIDRPGVAIESSNYDHRALTELISAVLTMAKGGAHGDV